MSSGNFQKAFLNNFTIFITLKKNKIILHHMNDSHKDLRTNPLQGGGDDVTPTSPASRQGTPSSPSPSRG